LGEANQVIVSGSGINGVVQKGMDGDGQRKGPEHSSLGDQNGGLVGGLVDGEGGAVVDQEKKKTQQERFGGVGGWFTVVQF